MEDMDKKEIKEVIEWCDEKGHSEHEILDLMLFCTLNDASFFTLKSAVSA